MEKLRVTQDMLYQYLTEHNVNISGLAREMGASATQVGACFLHNLDRLGKPRRFTPAALAQLNAALPAFAQSMRDSLISFGSDQTYMNRNGNAYDPGALPALKHLSQFFNLTAFAQRVMGWNKNKKNAIMSAPSSTVYGNISRNDVNRINAELLAVSGVLGNYEVIADE